MTQGDPSGERLREVEPATGDLLGLVHAATNSGRILEMTSQMGDILETDLFDAQPDMVKEHQMRMELIHVAYVIPNK